MNAPILPVAFASEEVRLLSGLFFGFLFGFVLERAGFGNARKLAGQFYLNDMTVFKVMFTAILVAMVGLFGLQAAGFADISLMWVNPTFVPAQAVGGFLLGVGFIMSGLCPGTSVVSMVSGRIDGWVAFAGIVAGIALFTVTVDWFPGLSRLYQAGSGEVSLLHEVMGVPALALVFLMVFGATAAFVGAEKVEGIFSKRHVPVELTPRNRSQLKLVLGGGLAVVTVLALAFSGPRPELPPIRMASLSPLGLAEAIIERQPGMLVLDLRPDSGSDEAIPGAVPTTDPDAALKLLRTASPQTTVVIYDEGGMLREAPSTWPRTLEYRFLDGGFQGWRNEVLQPAEAGGASLEEIERVSRQNQISAFFSGAAVQTTSVAAPPPAMSSGAKPKKKAGGC